MQYEIRFSLIHWCTDYMHDIVSISNESLYWINYSILVVTLIRGNEYSQIQYYDLLFSINKYYGILSRVEIMEEKVWNTYEYT